MSQHFDDFIHVPAAGTSSGPGVSEVYFNNTEGKRVFTEGVIVTSIRARHPKYHLTVVPAYQCDLIAFAQDHPKEVSYKRRDVDQDLLERPFFPPPRRYNDEYGGAFVERVVFGCYDYTYRGTTFLLYVADGRDGFLSSTRHNFILLPPAPGADDLDAVENEATQKSTDALVEACTKWGQELHEEVLVFDGGFWQKNKELWQNIQKANWDDVILDKKKKESIVNDIVGFFDSEEQYAEFGVPWKACAILTVCVWLDSNLIIERSYILRPSRGNRVSYPIR